MRLKSRSIIALILGLLLLTQTNYGKSLAAEEQVKPTEPNIKVDIPVSLKKAKVMFDIGRVTLTGDLPIALRFMEIMAQRFKEQGTEGQIIAEFYAGAAHLLLNDQAYNKHRQVNTGNPYKGLIADLQARGVQIEQCAMSMKVQKISNADLLPGVKVNSGANLRMVQLMQEGFLRLQP